MNPLKKLAGQTAIYGLSSIIGRAINFAFALYYTHLFSKSQFGVFTEMYTYVAFLLIFLTYGMETTFFRFSNKDEYEADKVFSTSLISVVGTSTIFILLCTFFSQEVANWLKYPDQSEYIIWFALIVGLDAISSIPLAKLRSDSKPIKFAVVNLVNIVVYIGLNLFLLVYLPAAHDAGGNFLTEAFYGGEISVGYVFIANLIASSVKFLILIPEVIKVKLQFVYHYWKKMIPYALPMMLIGLMGIINETFDRMVFKHVMVPIHGIDKALEELGVYGANYKIAMIMTMFIQAFRYAAEPFFFGKDKEQDKKKNLATIFKMLTAILSLMFLGVVLFQDTIMFLLGSEFREGREIVPILLLANMFLGLLVHVSMWYKLTNNTHLGAFLSLGGAVLTIGLNLWLIPIMSYHGSAWATLIVYFLMLVGSLIWGRKYYPVDYPLKKSGMYIGVALTLYLLTMMFVKLLPSVEYVFKICAIFGFVLLIYYQERPKRTTN